MLNSYLYHTWSDCCDNIDCCTTTSTAISQEVGRGMGGMPQNLHQITLFTSRHGCDFRGKVVHLLFDSFAYHQSAESNHLCIILVEQFLNSHGTVLRPRRWERESFIVEIFYQMTFFKDCEYLWIR